VALFFGPDQRSNFFRLRLTEQDALRQLPLTNPAPGMAATVNQRVAGRAPLLTQIHADPRPEKTTVKIDSRFLAAAFAQITYPNLYIHTLAPL
jgi:hypothetical protein